MIVSILREAGYVEAILGLSLSYGTDLETAKKTAKRLAPKDGGHNKFLESIYLWFDITAPRFWWQEADTYRLSTKQSESTMHTIQRRFLQQDDFEYPICTGTLHSVNRLIEIYQKTTDADDLLQIKNLLPEGFLQRRIWVMNYKTLRNILLQRSTHRLPQWQQFCAYVRSSASHPDLLPTANPSDQDTFLKFPVS